MLGESDIMNGVLSDDGNMCICVESSMFLELDILLGINCLLVLFVC